MKLIKILSDRIQIRTTQKEFEDVRINDLVSISDDSVELITMVTAVTESESEAGISEEDEFLLGGTDIKIVECSIIGSVHDGKFSNAIDKYPVTNVKAKEIATEEFKKMIEYANGKGFQIGKYAAYDCPAWVNGNRFFQRHACIVGNTGSGKSETVAKILESISKLKAGNVVVFDIHGEYAQLSHARNIKIGKDFAFPVWMFGLTGMTNNILKIRGETSTVVMSAIRKVYYKLCPDGREDRPVYFDYNLMLQELTRMNEEEITTGEIYKSGDKAGTPKKVKGEFYGKLTGVINSMTDKRQDRRYSFLFEERPQKYLLQVVHDIMDNDKPVKNIDLSDIPHDVAIPLIGVITTLIYGIQRSCQMSDITPITLVCDEAHVYIPNGIQLSASERRMTETFEEIAKEGRKFGVSLFVASQRPSELNKTIMAQCANFIVSKLNNENDKSMIRGMLPDGSESVVSTTTTFNPGEVLIIGDAVPIPLKIQVTLAEERPQSRTIEFWNKWNRKADMNLTEGIREYVNF